jgi:hypothetical protein
MLAGGNESQLKSEIRILPSQQKETLQIHADGSNERPCLLCGNDVENGNQMEQTLWSEDKEMERSRTGMAQRKDGGSNPNDQRKASGSEKDQESKVPVKEEEEPFNPTWQKPGEHEPRPGSAVIVDDIVLFAHAAMALLCYFICMVQMPQHHQVRIGRWRDCNKKQPAPGAATKEEEAQLLQVQWEGEDDKMLEELKQATSDRPVLKRPAPDRQFYLNSDWSCNAQGAVLLQAGCTDKDRATIKRELDGGDCKFKKTMGGLRLQLIAFISQRRSTPSLRHSFV